jgi:hypothetical protein
MQKTSTYLVIIILRYSLRIQGQNLFDGDLG